MSGDTSKGSESLNGSGRSADATGKSATPPIRDFIYLNQDRIFSYLSQMDGGLKLLYSRIRDEGWSETVSQDEKTTEAGGSAKGSFEGKVPLLAGMTGEAGLDWKHSTSTGGDSRTDYESRVGIDLFGLHHRAFDLVIERLGARLKTVTGKIMIADIDWLEEKIKDFPQIVKAVNVFNTDPKSKIKPPVHTSEIAYLYRAFMAHRTLIILRTDDGKVRTAYLDAKHFIAPTDNIIAEYGYVPTVTFTMVGIETTPQPFDEAGNFSVRHFQSDAGELAQIFGAFVGTMGNMRDFLDIKSRDGHIIPLGVFAQI